VEEQALYQAILAAPHDDTPRLVYADWLEENADRFPTPLAKVERARAEFIRVQCALARLLPFTPGTAVREQFLDYQMSLFPASATDPEPISQLLALARRQRRLLFTCGAKWRRAFHPSTASARFDRGFLRPLRSFTPQGFLFDYEPSDAGYISFPKLPPDSPALRYLPHDDRISHFPLWDLHLYGSDLRNDPTADRGQYGELLTRVGQSPRLARVGTLQVTFFRTPCADFLRTGNFANVETLILNCGPFPEVLEAVAANESFRNLRYVQFGADRWSWAGNFAVMIQHSLLWPKIQEANGLNLPYGEMRLVLQRILGEVGPMSSNPVPTPLPQVPAVPPAPVFGGEASPTTEPHIPRVWTVIGSVAFFLFVYATAFLGGAGRGSKPTPQPPLYLPAPLPNYPSPQPLDYHFDFDQNSTAKLLAEHEKLMKLIAFMKTYESRKLMEGAASSPGRAEWERYLRLSGKQTVTVAPPPREVPRKE
jgi:uncharacterized protein (TIGR02996 family)